MANESLASKTLNELNTLPLQNEQKIYKNVWCVLHACPDPRGIRIELYANENTKSGYKNVVFLEQAKWRKTGTTDSAFGLELKGKNVYKFTVNSREELKKWILYLCIVCKELFDLRQTVGVEDSGKVDLDSLLTVDNTVVQMNELYGSKSDAKMHKFFVAFKPDSDCPKMSLSGLYRLTVQEENISIYSLDSENLAATWSLFEIKKYGYNSCFFYLAAGSKANEREGTFAFYTTVGENIKNFLLEEANKIRELYKDEIAKNNAQLGASTSTDEIRIEMPHSSESTTDVYSEVNKKSLSASKTQLIQNPKVSSEKQKESKKGTKKEKNSNSEKNSKKSTKGKSKKQSIELQETPYADPWENKPHAQPSKKSASGATNIQTDKDIYAEPDKLRKELSTLKSRNVVHTENYEPFSPLKPEIIPPKWEVKDTPNNTSENYSHINRPAKEVVGHDNIYGMDSASAPLKPKNNAQKSGKKENNTDNDTYAHINRTAQDLGTHDNVYGMESASAPIKPKVILPKPKKNKDDSNNNDTYAHINKTAPDLTSHDNVYGMDSASAPIKPPVLDNPYEDTNPSTDPYEAVNY